MRHDPVSSLVKFLVAGICGPARVLDRARKLIGRVEAAHVADLFGYGDDLGSIVHWVHIVVVASGLRRLKNVPIVHFFA
jgi:hypothetical protein